MSGFGEPFVGWLCKPETKRPSESQTTRNTLDVLGPVNSGRGCLSENGVGAMFSRFPHMSLASKQYTIERTSTHPEGDIRTVI